MTKSLHIHTYFVSASILWFLVANEFFFFLFVFLNKKKTSSCCYNCLSWCSSVCFSKLACLISMFNRSMSMFFIKFIVLCRSLV